VVKKRLKADVRADIAFHECIAEANSSETTEAELTNLVWPSESNVRLYKGVSWENTGAELECDVLIRPIHGDELQLQIKQTGRIVGPEQKLG
jgi:hypothetical protein